MTVTYTLSVKKKSYEDCVLDYLRENVKDIEWVYEEQGGIRIMATELCQSNTQSCRIKW